METSKLPITPEQAVKILEKHGLIITVEQAKEVLEFLDKFARLAVRQYIK